MPLSIIFLCLILVTVWFYKGLLFAGGEESLMFYDLHRTYALFNSIWYETDTGYPDLFNIQRIPLFLFLSIVSNLGFLNIQIQAFTFFILLSVGSLAIFFLIRETVTADLELKEKKWLPFLAAVFYIFNPFSMSQIWGRGLTFQFFSFALVPAFLLFFIVGLKRKNIIFGLLAVLLSFFLSAAYAHPAIVLTSWANVSLYFLFYLFKAKKNKKDMLFACYYFFLVVLFWVMTQSFWIYPTTQLGNRLLEGSTNSTHQNNVAVLQGVSIHTPLQAVIRLVHNGAFYIDQIYGKIYISLLFLIISWLIPLVSFFAINVVKKCKDGKFFIALFLIALFFSIGSNFPTGWLLVWLFEIFPLLQVLRNPYEKFGINLLIAYIPFFTIGSVVLAERISGNLKMWKINSAFLVLLLFSVCVIFVWPMWNGSFAGGSVFNPWVKVPEYYKEADNWLNTQKEEFRILQVPLIPGDGIRYTWENNFQGIEPGQYIFGKASIGKDVYANKNHYAVLLDRFGKTNVGAYLPGRATDNLDFKDDSLIKELAKLNIRYIILHNDVDWQFNGSVSPEQTKEYLQKQNGINKLLSFGKLDIYRVEVPKNIDLVYSPDIDVTYKKLSNTNYQVEIKDAREPFSLYFLEQFDNLWEAYINGAKIADPSKVYSYANAWRVNKKGDYTISIRYKPQQTLETGFSVTKISLLAVVILIVVSFFIHRSNKAFSS